MELKDYIRSKRKLSDGSVNTYYYLLKSLWKNVYGDKPMNFDDFDSDDVYNYVNENRPKTTIAALCVITDNPRIRKIMEEELNKQKIEKSKQVKTEKQESSWLSATEIETKFNELKKKVSSWYKTGDLQDIQQFILLSLMSGIFIDPRRSKDWFDFKIKTITDKDNYLIRDKVALHGDELVFDKKGKKENVFVFNSYKGSNTKGQQLVIVPPELMKILKKWIDVNPTDYLLFDKNNEPLTAVKINQRMEKIFGKQASVNAFRHTHLTDKYVDMIDKMKDMKSTFHNMGSSLQQFETYVKH